MRGPGVLWRAAGPCPSPSQAWEPCPGMKSAMAEPVASPPSADQSGSSSPREVWRVGPTTGCMDGAEATHTKWSHSHPCAWPAVTVASQCHMPPHCPWSPRQDRDPRGTGTGPRTVRAVKIYLDAMSSPELQLGEANCPQDTFSRGHGRQSWQPSTS